MTEVPAYTSRAYESQQDLVAMRQLLVDGRQRTHDWRYPHLGDLIWNFFTLTCHLNPRDHVRLWHDASSALVGYVMLSEGPSLDWQVSPEFAWTHGIEAQIETQVMAWTDARLQELTKSDAARWSGALGAVARKDDTARIAFLEAHGFRRGGYDEVNMLRSLADPLPDVRLSTDYQVRAVASTGDEADRAGAESDVWRPYGLPEISGDDYARLMAMPGYERELDVETITPDGVIAAYVNGWLDPVNRIGDLGPVGAREPYRRQGLTRAALLECLRRMQARGMTRVCVTTGVTNEPARRLYESIGFEVVNASLAYARPSAG